MFHRWGFLLGEIWVLLLLAALLGLLAGWLIWGRRSAVTVNTGEADSLRAALDACTAKGRDQAARIAALEADVKAANTRAEDAHRAAENARADAKAADEAAKAAAAKAASAAPAASLMAAAPAKAEAKPKADDIAKNDDKTPAKPAALTAARGGKPDDLKLIKGIGPKLEQLCHKLGFYHFDQLANWTPKEIAWVDENLEGFKGRVTRDEWVQQARDLMNGLPPRPGGEN